MATKQTNYGIPNPENNERLDGSMITPSGRPVQILDWKDKTPQWYKSNVEFYIKRSIFNYGNQMDQKKDLRLLYEVYNNQFPLSWFSHITDPLSAKKKEHKKFPAKIRPVSILRTNLDLLLGEFPRRPFVYQVENLGDSGYNSFVDGMQKQAQSTLTQHFVQAALQQVEASGQQMTPQQVQQLQQDPPVPDEVKQQFMSSYKDAIAIKGQKFLDRQIRESEIRRKLHKCFKDWLIAGSAFTYKAIENDKFVYRRISPLDVDYDKSSGTDFIEDGDWIIHRELLTLSDVVDRFYQQLDEENQKTLDRRAYYNTPMDFYNHLEGMFTDPQERGKIPVYHVQWKGRKKIGFLTYLDMDTFQMVEEVVDEDYLVDRSRGEQVEWRWVNEVYEGWRITYDIYVGLQPAPVQRNELNNMSTCKFNYNGKRYSDTHSENISVLEFGLPFQIMYIIVTYILEKTIAKSKGKIVMMDQNAIPSENGWDEEKFFYYAEALGYALLDRNQIGVDKSWNQYQVLDMSLFDQIKQLIELQDYFKQQWDDVIGISRQRKGETLASDGQGVNERSVFQSTIITDMIFIGFEHFIERELQGVMDFGKFVTSKGLYATYNNDDYGTALLGIAPEDFMNEELGVFVADSVEVMNKLKEMKGYAQAIIQNQGKASTVLEIIDAVNIPDLKAKLKQIEAIEAQQAQANEQDQQQHEAGIEQMKEGYLKLEKLLDRQYMESEWDRKDENEMIKGSFGALEFNKNEGTGDVAADVQAVESTLQNRQKIENDWKDKQVKNKQTQDSLDLQKKQLTHQMDMDHKNHKLDKKKVSIAGRKKPSTKK